MNKIKLPMRLGVGVIVLNNENKIFVGKRKDNPVDKWQMPQGGIDKGEDNLKAALRELEEETSIKSVKLIKEIDGFTCLLYTSPSPRDATLSRMPSSA